MCGFVVGWSNQLNGQHFIIVCPVGDRAHHGEHPRPSFKAVSPIMWCDEHGPVHQRLLALLAIIYASVFGINCC